VETRGLGFTRPRWPRADDDIGRRRSPARRAKIAERNRRGKLFRARAGEIVYCLVPYGYRRIPRGPAGPSHLEVYEPEAVLVRRIFGDFEAAQRIAALGRGAT
jgi:hypothetical protein